MLEFFTVYYLIGLMLAICIGVVSDIQEVTFKELILFYLMLPILWLPLFIGGIFDSE